MPPAEERAAPEAREDALWRRLLNNARTLALAQRLPDAGQAEGRARTYEVLLSWMAEQLPKLAEETREELADQLLCYHLGDLTTRQGTLSLRAVVAAHRDDGHDVTIVAVGDGSARTLAFTEVEGELGATARPADMMRLAAALLEAISKLGGDPQRLALKTAFARLTQPFGSVEVGVALAPADRSQLRAARMKTHKRSKTR